MGFIKASMNLMTLLKIRFHSKLFSFSVQFVITHCLEAQISYK